VYKYIVALYKRRHLYL